MSAKIVSIPRATIHNWSFEPKLRRIIKKLVLKIFRQNLKIWLFSCIKNRHISEFCPKILRTNTSQLRLKWSIMNRNSWDWDHLLHFQGLLYHSVPNYTVIKSAISRKHETKFGIFGYCVGQTVGLRISVKINFQKILI